MTTFTLGLDIGGSHVTAGLIDPAGRRVVRTARRDVAHTAPLETLLRAWADAAREAAGAQTAQLSHLGIAIPGPFDLTGGQSHMSHKFAALRAVPLRPHLRRALGPDFRPDLPLRFGNDADLFALGEWWASPHPPERLIGVTLGTGLGSGFILRGAARQDGPGVPPGGELWSVPTASGTLEDLLCGAAVTRLGHALTGRQGSAADWAGAARQGQPAAQAVWAALGTQLADGLRPWTTAFGADALVLGGNVSRAFDLFGPAVTLGPCRVRPSEYFELAPLLGAAAL
ncbi:ROK family protein [Deinococcus kurensis]|uniref:ROK family protein n=1 Tax=Deinococcus kurensis TaxID=2662757 RepID=UPI0012D2C07B|nr:ROK family protein [Deinococcus kurensis]